MMAKKAMVAADTSTTTEIFYPETDGMPLPDGLYQYRHFLEILSILKFFFGLRDDVVVGGDIFIYYEEGNPQVSVAPDCFVVFGVGVESFERNNTYLMWDVGKAPDFVLEIGSPSTARNDLRGKRDLYARLGIGEYWRFDPSGGDHYGEPLVGESLVDGEYRELEMSRDVDGTVWGHSPRLNLELHWEDGRLRFYDPVGERWLRNMEETDAARESEATAREFAEARATSAEAVAETERSARESAEARLAELEAELRRIRGE